MLYASSVCSLNSVTLSSNYLSNIIYINYRNMHALCCCLSLCFQTLFLCSCQTRMSSFNNNNNAQIICPSFEELNIHTCILTIPLIALVQPSQTFVRCNGFYCRAGGNYNYVFKVFFSDNSFSIEFIHTSRIHGRMNWIHIQERIHRLIIVSSFIHPHELCLIIATIQKYLYIIFILIINVDMIMYTQQLKFCMKS